MTPEENIGKIFLSINCRNSFLDQSPKAKEIKAKINDPLSKLKTFAQQRKSTPNKTTTYRMGENIHKLCSWRGG